MKTHSKKEDKLKQQPDFGHVSTVWLLDFRNSRLKTHRYGRTLVCNPKKRRIQLGWRTWTLILQFNSVVQDRSRFFWINHPKYWPVESKIQFQDLFVEQKIAPFLSISNVSKLDPLHPSSTLRVPGGRWAHGQDLCSAHEGTEPPTRPDVFFHGF